MKLVVLFEIRADIATGDRFIQGVVDASQSGNVRFGHARDRAMRQQGLQGQARACQLGNCRRAQLRDDDSTIAQGRQRPFRRQTPQRFAHWGHARPRLLDQPVDRDRLSGDHIPEQNHIAHASVDLFMNRQPRSGVLLRLNIHHLAQLLL